MAENYNMHTLSPEDLQFLNNADTTAIIVWIFDIIDNKGEAAQVKIPAAWQVLETRIQEHPNEARETGAFDNLPIHNILDMSRLLHKKTDGVPLSLVQLLIEIHPEGLHFQDGFGNTPLHIVVFHPDIECFRAVLYNGNVEATTVQEQQVMDGLPCTRARHRALVLL